MKKKLLLLFILTFSFATIKAQTLSNLVFETTITPTTTTVDLTFDFSGVSTGDTFEWQLILALPDGSPDWGAGRNITYLTGIVPDAVGSGTQTVNLGVYNTPVIDEVFTWAGKITLGANGSDVGYNNTGNLVTISATAGLEDVNANGIVMYPNPVSDIINIKSNLLGAKSIVIFDVRGGVVKTIGNAKDLDFVNVNQLTSGFYFLTTDNGKKFKFLKK
tara:strand:- start:549 stop:1202 length:654 start_codon:yes stop_codon:yes gene_type:complete